MDLIDPAAIRGARFYIQIKFLGADDNECVVDMGRHTAVGIADVAGGSVRFGVQDPIDEDAHDSVQTAGHSDVVPRAVGDTGCATQSFGLCSVVDPEGDSTIPEGNTIFSCVQIFKDASIENVVTIHPIFPTRSATAGVVFTRVGFHPPFEGEIGGTNVGRPRWSIDRDLQPIDVIQAIPIKAERSVRPGVVQVVIVEN